MKHTPGPWKYEVVLTENGWTTQIQGDINPTSAVVVMEGPLAYRNYYPDGTHATFDTLRANARLISLAPEMLEALRGYVAKLEWLISDQLDRGETTTAYDKELESLQSLLKRIDP